MAETSYKRTESSNKTFYHDPDEYFMSIAALSMKYKNHYPQVGACIVNKDKRIVGIGYNDIAKGCNDISWNPKNNSDYKGFYVCHAEANAIINKISSDVNDCVMYVTWFPCNECAKLIVQSGIKTVIYASNKNMDAFRKKAAKKMFDAAGVTYRQYKPSRPKIFVKLIY